MTAQEIATACEALCGSPHKPTLPEVRPLVDAYYKLDGNGAGGELHVVLDDYNYERHCISYCIENAKKDETIWLGRVLLKLSNSQRRRL